MPKNPSNPESQMEVVMHKHLAKHDNYQPASGRLIGAWLSFLRRCSDARKLRKAGSDRAEIVAALNDLILYDIGEQDLRPCRSALAALNPHKLLIDAVLNRDSVEFDPRR
jgi:hypothetical protein